MDDSFHVPQQNRRHKLRYLTVPHHDSSTSSAAVFHHSLLATSPATSALNLSLSTHARTAGAYSSSSAAAAAPVGPFTGYAAILARSRFLRPAQDLLDAFSAADGGVVATVSSPSAAAMKRILEESGGLFCDDDEVISRRCTNPNLVSMLHEVYRKYKLYCQQMQSAVTSFESVAGLGNAAPFISFAVRAMFRHFHCLKNAILDQIRVSSKGFGSGEDCRRERDLGSCPDDKSPYDPKQNMGQDHGSGPNFLQHPVWRSQRGFPDKAVAVLRTWLFEHFLHPYPSDTEKQMLAQKTGLSRSQVSNWFTNARVRLWKPMVEEIHTLERKAQCSKATNTPFINLSSSDTSLHPQLTEQDFEIVNHRRNHESHSKRTRTEADPRAEQSKEHFSLLSTHSIPGIDSHQIDLSHQQNTSGISWPPQGQILPFWLARQ